MSNQNLPGGDPLPRGGDPRKARDSEVAVGSSERPLRVTAEVEVLDVSEDEFEEEVEEAPRAPAVPTTGKAGGVGARKE